MRRSGRILTPFQAETRLGPVGTRLGRVGAGRTAARPVRAATLLVLAVTLLALPGCGRKGPDAPGREVVTPLLQQEAEALKRDGEKLDPVLLVKATWTIEAVEVTERPGDADRPWAGSIRFKIRSEMRDVDGSVSVDEFVRRFDYVYTSSLQRWVFHLAPSPKP